MRLCNMCAVFTDVAGSHLTKATKNIEGSFKEGSAETLSLGRVDAKAPTLCS
jgi:hypothetical protein